MPPTSLGSGASRPFGLTFPDATRPLQQIELLRSSGKLSRRRYHTRAMRRRLGGIDHGEGASAECHL